MQVSGEIKGQGVQLDNRADELPNVDEKGIHLYFIITVTFIKDEQLKHIKRETSDAT